MGTIKESLTFDDVLLRPQYSNVLPSETDISINLTNFRFSLLYKGWCGKQKVDTHRLLKKLTRSQK